ncbi:hypothetical protein NKH18_06185 [Streptomyces sp. M10(2022)]
MLAARTALVCGARAPAAFNTDGDDEYLHDPHGWPCAPSMATAHAEHSVATGEDDSAILTLA